jgi:hypothetical protein
MPYGYTRGVLRATAALVLALATLATPAAASVRLGRLDPNPSSGSATEAAPDGSRYHGCDYVGVLYVPGQTRRAR